MLTATVSGSFHRHLAGIYTAVNDLRAAGVNVLSPADPRVVDHIGEFLFVASDRVRSIQLVQDRHLQCIGASTFLWLVAPDGYLGPSASMEIGYAAATKTPVFCVTTPTDATLKEYVRVIPGINEAILEAQSVSRAERRHSFLIDPAASIETIHRRLDCLNGLFEAAKLSDRSSLVDQELKHTKQYLANVFDL